MAERKRKRYGNTTATMDVCFAYEDNSPCGTCKYRDDLKKAHGKWFFCPETRMQCRIERC